MEESKENICAEKYQKIVNSFILGFVKLFAAKLITVASSKGLNKIQMDRMKNDEFVYFYCPT
ncbi:MAG: hypothetical protein OEV87_04185 [Phycisphaerae bacterium]|nr:hypothetical protein [Phycisphaerae bacterium]